LAEVRVHLAQMSTLLTQMITNLLAPEQDIEIVGRTEGSGDSLLAARAEGANMIITQTVPAAMEPSLAAIVDDLPLTILAIVPTGSTSISIRFARREIGMRGNGAKSLAEVVREAAVARVA
jgi:hypothetical protein